MVCVDLCAVYYKLGLVSFFFRGSGHHYSICLIFYQLLYPPCKLTGCKRANSLERSSGALELEVEVKESVMIPRPRVNIEPGSGSVNCDWRFTGDS